MILTTMELENTFPNYDINDITEIYNQIEIESLRKQLKSTYSFEIWDKVSDVNGNSPQAMLDNSIFTLEGENLIIYKENNVILVQGFDPYNQGFVRMDSKRATEVAELIIKEELEKSLKGIAYTVIQNEISERGIRTKQQKLSDDIQAMISMTRSQQARILVTEDEFNQVNKKLDKIMSHLGL